MKMVVLVENSSRCRLCAEHGLSVYIEYKGKKYLLDTGATALFAENAKELGIDAIDESVNEYFCPMLFYAMSVAYRTGLQDKRRHPLDMRRYMGVVEY